MRYFGGIFSRRFLRKQKGSKGGTHLDWIIAFTIFISFVIIAVGYISYLSVVPSPYSEPLRSQGMEVAEKVKENISWTVYRSTITVNSNNASSDNYTLDTYFKAEAAVDLNSIAILDEKQLNDSNEGSTPSQFDSSLNELMWHHNLSQGDNIFYLIYTKNTSLSDLSYTSDLVNNSDWVNNTKINVSFEATGINSLFFNDQEVLDETNKDILLGTSSSTTTTIGDVRARLRYTEGKIVKIYNNESRIVITNLSTTDVVTLYLDEYFTKLWDEDNGTELTIADFDSSNQYSANNARIVDIFKSSSSSDIGIAAIGDNIDAKVYDVDLDYRILNVTGVTEFELYLHDGDYSNAKLAEDMFLNAPEIIIGTPEEITGISRSGYQNFKSTSQADIKKFFGIEGIDFLVSLENRTV